MELHFPDVITYIGLCRSAIPEAEMLKRLIGACSVIAKPGLARICCIWHIDTMYRLAYEFVVGDVFDHCFGPSSGSDQTCDLET